MNFSVVIVDDEAIACARLRRLLSDHPDIRIVAECADGHSAMEAVVRHRPDLVFLDIQMPELNGFQVLAELPKRQRPACVFVTAHEDYALEAFAVDALDYLLKPLGAERLKLTLDRVRRRLGAEGDRQAVLTSMQQMAETQRDIQAAIDRLPLRWRDESSRTGTIEGGAYAERLTVRNADRIRFLPVNEIDYIRSAANYVRVHAGQEAHLIRERLGDLERRLNPRRFARIHRTAIVNLDRIKEIQPWFGGDAIVILRNGAKLRLSRTYRHVLQA